MLHKTGRRATVATAMAGRDAGCCYLAKVMELEPLAARSEWTWLTIGLEPGRSRKAKVAHRHHNGGTPCRIRLK